MGTFLRWTTNFAFFRKITTICASNFHKFLSLVAELSGRTISNSVFDSAIITRSGLPAEDVRNYLNELEGLGFITMGIKVSGADFRTVNMIQLGLEESSGDPGVPTLDVADTCPPLFPLNLLFCDLLTLYAVSKFLSRNYDR